MFTPTDGDSRIGVVGGPSRAHRASAAPTCTDTERTITDGDRAEAWSAPFPTCLRHSGVMTVTRGNWLRGVVARRCHDRVDESVTQGGGDVVFRGYARVAPHGEDPSDQAGRLCAAGVEPAQLRIDHSSGARGARPELDSLLAELTAGDVLVVTGLERLASSVLHLVAIGQRLHAAEAELCSLDEAVDTRTPSARGLVAALDLLAGLQRTLVSGSTRAGLDAARTRGRRGGRPPRLDPEAAAEARRLYGEGHSVTEIAERLEVPRTTLYGHLHRPS
jgi:DNA invertase Pin-like site-specific DNA recombinase